MADYRVIDADGHVRESDRALRSLLGPLGERRALFPGDSWDRHLRNTLGQSPDSPQQQLADTAARLRGPEHGRAPAPRRSQASP